MSIKNTTSPDPCSDATASGSIATQQEQGDFRQLFSELAETGVFCYDPQQKALSADKQFFTLLGVPHPGQPSTPLEYCLATVHTDDRQRVFDWFARASGSEYPAITEFKINTLEGGQRIMRCKADNRNHGELRGILTDITAEKQQQRLARLELDLAIMLNSSHTLHEILKYTTETAMEIAGVETGGIYFVNPVSRNLELAWQTGLEPEILKRVVLLTADSPNAQIVFRQQAVFSTHREIIEEAGIATIGVIFKAMAVLPIIHRGEVIGCLNLASSTLETIAPEVRPTLESVAGRLGHNIAEAKALASLREREENLNLLLDTSPDMMVVFDYQGTILHVNKTACTQLHYTSAELEGQPLQTIYPTSYAAELREVLTKITEETISETSLPLLSKQLRWINVETYVSKIVWKNQPAFFASSRDITTKLETQEMIRSTAELFYSLGSNPYNNMNAIVKRACQILGGVAALYNRLDDDSQSLVVWAGYDLPGDMILRDDPSGHICYEAAICGEGTPVILENLEHTVFFDSDPNVKKYGLKAYLGHPISLKGVNVGSLAVVYDTPRQFNQEAINTIITLARALSLEEERIAAMKALAESELLYRSVIEQMSDLFYRTDTEGKVLLASPSAVKLTGYQTVEELIGRNIREFYKNPETRDEMLRLIKENGSVTDFQLEMVKKDGTMATVSVSSHFLYSEKGEVMGVEGIIRDITDRITQQNLLQASEEKFRNIAENTSDAILILNHEGMIEYASPGIYKLEGRTPERVTGWNADDISQVIHPNDRQEVFDNIYKAIEAKKPDLTYSYRSKHEKGHYYYREDHARFTYDAEGKLLKAYISCRDITERHQAHLELLEAKERAEASDKLKSSFLANISHEIRTPLNGILGFAEVLKTPELGVAERNECVEIINQSGNQLLAIISDIVEVSKIETGQATVSITSFPVIEVLRMVYNSFRKADINPKISFVINTSKFDHSAQVITDLTRLQQILSNLTDNALKFTNEGSVELGARQTEPGVIQFYVTDTGPGIKSADQTIIFERFRQLDGTLARARGGTGLGLTICKAYAEMLGSSIRVNSEPGIGSTFSIDLPLDEISTMLPKPQEDDAEPFQNKYPDLTGIKVLVVEDEEVNMLYLHILLTRCKAIVVKAGDGSEALTMLNHHPDIRLVLMDIRMPGMNGLEATRAIRVNNKKLPIVAQTACAMAQEKEEAYEAGCTGYITKPIREADFLKMIREVFQ